MNLTFAAAAEPRNRHRYGEPPKAPPEGLASTAPPVAKPPGTKRPVTMPKIIWPEQLRWKSNGKIDMRSLDMPFLLKKLLDWRQDHPDVIDITGPPDPYDKDLADDGQLERRKAEAKRWDDENNVRPYRLREWHAVETKFPQPPHGIEGAAEHARILRKDRKKLRRQLSAAVESAALLPESGGGSGGGGGGGGGGDDRRQRSPAGSFSSTGRLLPPEMLLSSSPGAAAYVGSPRSLGRLCQLARPFPDKNNVVAVVAQPSLIASPRGGMLGGIGGSTGGVGDGRGGSGNSGGAAAKLWGTGSSGASGGIGDNGSGSGGSPGGLVPATHPGAATISGGAGGAAPGVPTKSKPPPVPREGGGEKDWTSCERKVMGEKVFALFLPKWREHDNSVDQPSSEEDEKPRGASAKVAKKKAKASNMGDWGSRLTEGDEENHPSGYLSGPLSSPRPAPRNAVGLSGSGPTLTMHLSSTKQGAGSFMGAIDGTGGRASTGGFSADNASSAASSPRPASAAIGDDRSTATRLLESNNSRSIIGERSSRARREGLSKPISISGKGSSPPARSPSAASFIGRDSGSGRPQQRKQQQQQQDAMTTAGQPLTPPVPSAANYWPPVSEKPHIPDQMVERAERNKEDALRDRNRSSGSGGNSGGGAGNGRSSTLKPPVSGGRSLSDSSTNAGWKNPGPSPAGPTVAEGGLSPPLYPLEKAALGKSPIGQTPVIRSPLGRSSLGQSPLEQSPLARSPPSAATTAITAAATNERAHGGVGIDDITRGGTSSAGSSRSGGGPRQQYAQGEKGSPTGGESGGESGGGGSGGQKGSAAATAATARPPQKISRSSSDSLRYFENWGKRVPKKQREKNSPKGVHSPEQAGRSSSGRARGGSGKGLGRSPLRNAGLLCTPSSSLEQHQPGGFTARLVGDKLKMPLGRPPMRRPVDPSPANANPRSYDCISSLSEGHSDSQGTTGLGSDNTTYEAFDRDGHDQASYGSAVSTGPPALGVRGGPTAAAAAAATDTGFPRREPPSAVRSRVNTSDSSFARSRSGTVYRSEASLGGGGARKSRPIAEQEFNPFQTADERQLLRIRTHNRRRWSHVFSRGETEFQTTDTMPGPIYRSLCQPVLLPTSIDHVPTQKILEDDYVESGYDIAIANEFKNNLERAKLVVEEMVAQRIAQDFQLVEQPAETNVRSRLWTSYQQLAKRGRDFSTNNNFFTVREGLVHIVSMGHRLQTISYTQENSTVKVRRFTLKAGMDSENSAYEYSFSLWGSLTGYSQPVKQEFYKYPKPPYNFNYVDQLISGDEEELWEVTKYRRLLFNIVPPKVANAEEEEAFADALDRFAEHLNSKRMLVPQDPRHGTAPTVSFTLRRKFPKVSAGGVDENNGGDCQAARNGRAESATASSRRRSSEYSGRGGERKGGPPMGSGRRPHGSS
ncbi:unnamed protein product, partial [Ectocarpus sp. 4 AP-2014]